MNTLPNAAADILASAPSTSGSSLARGKEVALSDRRPLPPTLTVLEARDAYLAENGFDTSGYTAPTFDVEAFGKTYTFENTRDRKWAIPLHDLHHVATGYGTDLVGEAEVGAFELMGGCKTSIVYALNMAAVVMGFFLAPLRTVRAFADARRVHALFRRAYDYDELLRISLGDLRERLGIPRHGLNREPRRLHDAREATRPDALPGAPRQPLWVVVFGVIHGLTTFGIVAFELLQRRSLEGVALDAGGARWIGIGVAVLAALLAASAMVARRGSLAGRAVFGHAAFGLVVLNLVSVVFFGMAPALAAVSIAGPLVLLWSLARRS